MQKICLAKEKRKNVNSVSQILLDFIMLEVILLILAPSGIYGKLKRLKWKSKENSFCAVIGK